MSNDSSWVRVFEVGPRDGLQNEPKVISLQDKAWFVTQLSQAGIGDLELGAFVRPERVPQMADTDELYRMIQSGDLDLNQTRAWSLVPNAKGLERALAVGVSHIAVFTAATESFAQKNIGMSIEKSIQEFKGIIDLGRSQQGSSFRVRAYVSTAFGCPFEGQVPPEQTLKVIQKLAKLGVDQISVGDTIGVATPLQVNQVTQPALKEFGPEKIAVHFHDTRGTALANALRSIDLGVRTLDSSAGGLGGCPFAPGATGNLATEDLVYMLNGLGLSSGINLDELCKVSLEFSKRINTSIRSRYLQAYISQCEINK